MDKLPYETLEKMLADARRRTVGSTWRHYKGGKYVVSGLAIMEATNEVAVLYSSLDHPTVSFVRPINIWSELVEWNGKTVPRLRNWVKVFGGPLGRG